MTMEVIRTFEGDHRHCQEIEIEPGAGPVRIGVYGDEKDIEIALVSSSGDPIANDSDPRDVCRRRALDLIDRIRAAREMLTRTDTVARVHQEKINGIRAETFQRISAEVHPETGKALYSNEASRAAACAAELGHSIEFQEASELALEAETIARKLGYDIEADFERLKVYRAFLHGS